MEKVYELKKKNSTAVIAMLTAEISLHQVEEVKNGLYALIDEGKNIILNLSKITFISSSLIMVLVLCLKKASECGKKLILSNLTPEAEQVLKITHMDRVFPFYDTENDALKVLEKKVKE